MDYSITLKELIERPIIRNDYDEERMNKMTDDEIKQYEKEVEQILLECVIQKYPDWNAAYLSKHIDRDILYKLFKKLIEHNGWCMCSVALHILSTYR